MKFYSVLIFMISFQCRVFAQGIIFGKVVDQISDEGISSAVIKIENHDQHALSNEKGEFILTGIKDAFVILDISHVGYQTKHQSITTRGIDSLGLIIHLVQAVYETGAVIVTGNHEDKTDDNIRSMQVMLKGKALEKELGNTIAATLKNETGIAMRTMGPAPARPVIRGLSGDRVQILEDGFSSNDMSATSPDHAVAIESMNTEKIEVVRGPKVLLSNASSVGGVVNVIKNDIPQSMIAHIMGTVGGFAETANKGNAVSSSIAIPLGSFVSSFEGSKRQTGNMSTPVGTINNSDIDTYSYSCGVSYFGTQFQVGGNIREFNSDYGVPGGFVGAHPNGVDISMFKRDISFLMKYLTSFTYLPKITMRMNRNYYRHQEFENAGLIGAEFSIFTYNPNISIETKDLGYFQTGEVTLSYDYRDFKIGGYVFSPPVISNKMSFAVYQKADFDDFQVELACRMENTQMVPQQTQRSTKKEYMVTRRFTGYSGSAGFTAMLSQNTSAGITFSRYARIPTIEELYSEGPHLAAYSYEVGKPDLQMEFGNAWESYLHYSENSITINLTGFYYSIPYYITPRNSGRINYATLLPIYATSGVAAHLLGAETNLSLDIIKQIRIINTLSYTRGNFAHTNEPLPGIAPLKITTELQYKEGTLSSGARIEYCATQNRIDTFEEKTDAYCIVNAYIQKSFPYAGMIHNASVMVDNILNTEYRNHLSRIKSILPEAGRDIRVLYKLLF